MFRQFLDLGLVLHGPCDCSRLPQTHHLAPACHLLHRFLTTGITLPTGFGGFGDAGGAGGAPGPVGGDVIDDVTDDVTDDGYSDNSGDSDDEREIPSADTTVPTGPPSRSGSSESTDSTDSADSKGSTCGDLTGFTVVSRRPLGRRHSTGSLLGPSGGSCSWIRWRDPRPNKPEVVVFPRGPKCGHCDWASREDIYYVGPGQRIIARTGSGVCASHVLSTVHHVTDQTYASFLDDICRCAGDLHRSGVPARVVEISKSRNKNGRGLEHLHGWVYHKPQNETDRVRRFGLHGDDPTSRLCGFSWRNGSGRNVPTHIVKSRQQGPYDGDVTVTYDFVEGMPVHEQVLRVHAEEGVDYTPDENLYLFLDLDPGDASPRRLTVSWGDPKFHSKRLGPSAPPDPPDPPDPPSGAGE